MVPLPPMSAQLSGRMVFLISWMRVSSLVCGRCRVVVLPFTGTPPGVLAKALALLLGPPVPGELTCWPPWTWYGPLYGAELPTGRAGVAGRCWLSRTFTRSVAGDGL